MMFGVIRLARYRKKRMISREFHFDGLIYTNRYYSRMNIVFNMSESYKEQGRVQLILCPYWNIYSLSRQTYFVNSNESIIFCTVGR